MNTHVSTTWLMKIEHHQYLWRRFIFLFPSHLFRHSFYSEFLGLYVLAFICSLIAYLHRQNINILKICINGVICHHLCFCFSSHKTMILSFMLVIAWLSFIPFWCCMMFRWMSIQDLSNLYTYILLIYLGLFPVLSAVQSVKNIFVHTLVKMF